MRDEFWILRPAILLSAGLFVLGIVLHTCRQATEERARFTGRPMAGAGSVMVTGGPSSNPVIVLQVYPPGSLPGTSPEAPPVY